MKSFIILFLLCGSLYGADTNSASPTTTSSTSAPKRLVEVVFAADDMAPTQSFHTVILLSVSSNWRASQRFIYNWAAQGGGSPDTNAMEEATTCLKLLKPLDQPKNLPESPNHIVTVSCLDGDAMLEKRFPIDQVPDEVHQMLAVMGFRDDQFGRLKFIQKPGQAAFTNYNKSIIFDGR